ncbi:MAG: DNA alkylation repair protein [Bacteroidota bacterium]
MMTFQEVIQELEAMGTAQNRKIYRRHGAQENLYGVSFANYKKLKKKIRSPEGKKGINHEVAIQLMGTGNADAQTFGAMIGNPQKLTEQQAEDWIKEAEYYPVADYLGTLIYASPWREAKMKAWTQSNDEFFKRVGFGLVNQAAREASDLPDAFFLPFIEQMEKEIQQSPNRAKEGMNNCLIAIGGRNEALRKRVLQAAEVIGPVEIDHGETSCKTFVIEEYVAKIWDRKAKLAAKAK